MQVKKDKKGAKKEVTTPADPLTTLTSLRKCVEDLGLFVQKDHADQADQADHAKASTEQEDKIDHLK